MTITLANFLSTIPNGLRDELLAEYNKIITNYRENRWGPTELYGGTFCEITYSILAGYGAGVYPAKAQKPPNMYDACKALEKLDQNKFCRSVRIQIPRMLGFLYEVRNNRGVGHVGGDVDPNLMDATCVVSSVKWIMAELVRLFHQVSTEAATGAVESITQKEVQLVWDVNDKKRVLSSGLGMKESVMLLLYSCIGDSASEQQLFEWTEHSNKAVFKKNVLKSLHKTRYVEYDTQTAVVKISPTGTKYVEDNLLK